MRFMHDCWHFDASDGEKTPYLVHYSDTPFNGDQLTLAAGDLDFHPSKSPCGLGPDIIRSGEKNKQLLVLHLNTAGPKTLDGSYSFENGFVDAYSGRGDPHPSVFDASGMVPGNPDDPVAVSYPKYAALIPLTKELFNEIFEGLWPSIFGQFTSLSPIRLTQECVFFAPEDSQQFPDFGQKKIYAPGSIHDAITGFLKEKEIPVLNCDNPEMGHTVTYEGQPVDMTSYEELFPIEVKEDLVHLSYGAFNSVDRIPGVGITNPMPHGAFTMKNQYFQDFLSACFFDEVINFGDVLDTVTKHIKGKEKLAELHDVIDERKRKYAKFYRLWQLEKEWVLTEKKSFLRSPDYIQIMALHHGDSFASLADRLYAIRVDYDFAAELLPLQFMMSDSHQATSFPGGAMQSHPKHHGWQFMGPGSNRISRDMWETPADIAALMPKHYSVEDPTSFAHEEPFLFFEPSPPAAEEGGAAAAAAGDGGSLQQKLMAAYPVLTRDQVRGAYENFRKQYGLIDANTWPPPLAQPEGGFGDYQNGFKPGDDVPSYSGKHVFETIIGTVIKREGQDGITVLTNNGGSISVGGSFRLVEGGKDINLDGTLSVKDLEASLKRQGLL